MAGRHGRWAEFNPVQKAFRTVGLVRGEQPYALVVDDCRKDDGEHLYEWLMQVPDDVKLDVERASVGLGEANTRSLRNRPDRSTGDRLDDLLVDRVPEVATGRTAAAARPWRTAVVRRR